MAWTTIHDEPSIDLQTYGITTGTCAAAAACASAYYLLCHEVLSEVRVETPEGIQLLIDVENQGDPRITLDASCGAMWFRVRKDAGADPDITDGIAVYALVEHFDGSGGDCVDEGDGPARAPFEMGTDGITSWLVGGLGVGKVTLPGLKVPVGEPAINPGPRSMIASALTEVGVDFPVRVTVAIPDGVALAERTFNPRLGIVGGISVLGTTGFVRPMSAQALLDALDAELDVRLFEPDRPIALAFGASGEKVFSERYGVDAGRLMQMSNYVGHVFDGAVARGAYHILMGGHPGKMTKVSAGSMNTHSSMVDARSEVLVAHAALAGAGEDILAELWVATTTQAAIEIIREAGLSAIWDSIAQRAADVLSARAYRMAGRRPIVACVMFGNDGDILGASADLRPVLESLRIGRNS
ncbi:MAG: cobalamin biosynthesis protein CbiD [Actinobacteria bacterium]|nr:cobalamin biosynthesis protein CbiD [Actinomycetota bacterium]